MKSNQTKACILAILTVAAACAPSQEDASSDEADLRRRRIVPTPCTGTGSATLAWDANGETDLAGYKLYYGSSAPASACPPASYSGVVDVGNVTTHVVANLPLCTTTHFWITAYNAAGSESCFSKEVTKTL
jgi:hypothetical protein